VKDQLQQLSVTAGKSNPAISHEITRITSNVDNLTMKSRDISGSLQTSMQAHEDILKVARGQLPLERKRSP